MSCHTIVELVLQLNKSRAQFVYLLDSNREDADTQTPGIYVMEIVRLDGDLEILVNYGEEPTVTLRGEVDFRNMSRVRQAICGLVEHGKRSVRVDLEELVFMDSTGVSALVDAAKVMLPTGGNVKLVSPSPQLVKVIEKSGASNAFSFEKGPVEHKRKARETGRHVADRVEFEVPSRAEMIAYIRSRVADFACSLPFDEDQIEDIKLAVGEASANALRHGANPDWCRVGVKMEKDAGGVKISITDKGCGFDPGKVCTPTPGSLHEGGRGIMFMRALMDEVRFHFSSPGTCVELVKRLAPA